MSMFGSLMGDIEEDPFFGSHMRTMRQMNNMMNSLFTDPFQLFSPQPVMHHQRNSLLPFNNFPMQNYNRLLNNSMFEDFGNVDSSSSCFSSSTVVSMSSGPDGRPQVFKATSSTRTAPGGVTETQKTYSDSVSGTKKMSIGHHIGHRAHIIEREENYRSGDSELKQDFINLEEDEADDFNREWETKAHTSRDMGPRMVGDGRRRHGGANSHLPAITAGPTSSRRHRERAHATIVSPRRGIRSSPLALPPSTSNSPSIMVSNRAPYNTPGHQPHVRKQKNVKTVSGSPSTS